jgi:hypothetical protein
MNVSVHWSPLETALSIFNFRLFDGQSFREGISVFKIRTVRSESSCALRLRYVDLVVSIDAREHHFQHPFISAQRLS